MTSTCSRNERGLVAREPELALLLIGTRHRRGQVASRIAELVATVDQDALAAVLAHQRMLPLAGTRLVECEPAGIRTPFRRRLDATIARARVRARGMWAVTSGVLDALERAGIRALPLKGSALARELYGDEALRETADVDVLVALPDLERAAAITRTLGWAETVPTGGKLPRLHHILYHPDGALPVVELHWRIHWYEARFAQVLLDRSRICDGLRRLDPVDELAALLLFYARDGFAGLRYMADIAAWWDRHGSSAVPARLEDLMAEHPALAEPWRAALVASVAVGGLPAAVAPAGCRPRSRRGRLAPRLANWDLRGDPDQINANVALMDGLLAPRTALAAFVCRQLLRPPHPLDTSGGLAPGAHARRLVLGGLHTAKILLRSLFALWRIRRGRSWSPLPPSLVAQLNGVPEQASSPRDPN